jgi:hypothetical protein
MRTAVANHNLAVCMDSQYEKEAVNFLDIFSDQANKE